MGYPLPRRGPTGAPGTQRGVPVHRNPTQPFLTGAQPLVVTLSGTLTQRLLRVISSPRRVAGRPKCGALAVRRQPEALSVFVLCSLLGGFVGWCGRMEFVVWSGQTGPYVADQWT